MREGDYVIGDPSTLLRDSDYQIFWKNLQRNVKKNKTHGRVTLNGNVCGWFSTENGEYVDQYGNHYTVSNEALCCVPAEIIESSSDTSVHDAFYLDQDFELIKEGEKLMISFICISPVTKTDKYPITQGINNDRITIFNGAVKTATN